MPIKEILQPKVGAKVNKTPRVSVVVPAYNAHEFIDETLDSVLAQTFADYEIIVVNDGSPDSEKLEKVLENYYENIVYIKQENGGTARARNAAIKAARGSLLAFLDADDVWLPEYLSAQIKTLDAKNSDFIYADARMFGAVKNARETFMKKSPSRGTVKTESLIEGVCSVITSGTIAKREKVVACGMFDEDLPRIGMEDFDLWFRLLKSGARADYQRRVLLKYRVSPNSLSGSNVARARRAIVALDTLERKHELNEREKSAMAKRRQSAQAELELETGKFNLAAQNYEQASDNFRRANRYYRSLKLKIVIEVLRTKPELVLGLFKKFRPIDFSFVNPQSAIAASEAGTNQTAQNQLSLSNQSVWLLFGKVVGFALSILLSGAGKSRRLSPNFSRHHERRYNFAARLQYERVLFPQPRAGKTRVGDFQYSAV